MSKKKKRSQNVSEPEPRIYPDFETHPEHEDDIPDDDLREI